MKYKYYISEEFFATTCYRKGSQEFEEFLKGEWKKAKINKKTYLKEVTKETVDKIIGK